MNIQKCKKILIVDDANSIRLFLSEMLLEAGYEVMTASSGEEALITLKDFIPDLVLLDVIMPGINGYEVCRNIRKEAAYKFIKIIMVSAEKKLEERLQGYQSGADDYLQKPFDKEELLAKVRVFLRLKSVEDQLLDLNNTLNEQVKIRSEQLIESEKMATIGRHTAQVIHNLKNPLNYFMGSIDMLLDKYPGDEDIELQNEAAEEMQKIITTIMTAGYRESVNEPEKINFNEIIKNKLELLKTHQFYSIDMKIYVQLLDLPLFSGIYSHFSQTFSNLINNAVESMYNRKDSILSIDTFVENDKIIIRIADNGSGIPKEKIDKVFNPFYTTKPLSIKNDMKQPTGTGLGLAYCKEMIESYGGKISVKSGTDKGTVFTIKLNIKE